MREIFLAMAATISSPSATAESPANSPVINSASIVWFEGVPLEKKLDPIEKKLISLQEEIKKIIAGSDPHEVKRQTIKTLMHEVDEWNKLRHLQKSQILKLAADLIEKR